MNNRLHGFGFLNDSLIANAPLCANLFADERYMGVINAIAKKYADRFMWRGFSNSNGQSHAELVYTIEPATNSDIALYINGNPAEKTGDITIIFTCTPDVIFTDAGADYLQSWNMNIGVKVIADDILRLLDAYLTGGISDVYDVQVHGDDNMITICLDGGEVERRAGESDAAYKARMVLLAEGLEIEASEEDKQIAAEILRGYGGVKNG